MDELNQAILVIKQGGIVIFPTDTAFGIGCSATYEESVKKLFEIRRRPQAKATPVLFDSVERVREFVLPIDPKVEHLMETYWPGALTIILESRTQKVPSMVRGGGTTLGVRIPDHEIPNQLIKGANVPILGPSANFNGESTPYKFEELDKELIKLVDFVIEGKTKGKNLASTVIDCTAFPWKIVRQGAINLNL